MLSFPNCKINLGLRIIRRREDGYHDLQTIFYPLAIWDVLESIRSVSTSFTATGIPIPGDPAGNLCMKAWRLLSSDFPDLHPVDIHLHKHIPIGAGLGGGSSDGAAMLMLLNQQFQLGLSRQQLIDYAARLGSDCPFFVINEPCYATGRGEQLTPIVLDLAAYAIVLVNPGIHVSTPWAFSQCRPYAGGVDLLTIVHGPVEGWKDGLVNDFEAAIFPAHPEIKAIKQKLYAAGAVYAAMSGSGSAVFGLFEKKNELPDAAMFPGYYFAVIR